MSKGWSEMRLRLAEYLVDVRDPRLTVEQQGRLALAWPGLFLRGDGSAEGWRKALGYSEVEWQEVGAVFTDILWDSVYGNWALPFMRSEWARQQAYSDQQKFHGMRGGKGRGGVAKGSLTNPKGSLTNPNHAVAVAVGVEPESQSLLSTDGGRDRVQPVRKAETEDEKNWRESFPLFWEDYPRKQKRLDAEKAWEKLDLKSQEGFDRVIAGLDRWKASRQWQDVQYVPLAGTWLRAAQYEDEIPEVGHAVR